MKSPIVLIVLILILAGMIFFMTMPLYRNVRSLKAQLEQQEQALENAQNLADVLDQLSRQFGSQISELSKVEVAVPKEDDLPRLLVEITTLASQNGLSVSEVSFGEKKQGQGVNFIPIALKASGNYLNLKSFLIATEQNLRILDLTQLGFGASEGGQYSFDFAIQTYTQ
ncbi:hypothetical protein C4553_02125 [Candidatus Parcubacteria bacterium]|nr:MAG: hypothetical protein C4553_02125 [Candidatus Parcubacteria bacterium]